MAHRNNVPVVLYGRVSSKPRGESRSVDDQLAELRRWAEREGWNVLGEFRDDGISASRFAKGKAREGWQDAITVIESGRLSGGALLVWEFSRATRDEEVSAALKIKCITHGVKIGYNGALRDPSTADGSFDLGLDALLAARESAKTSERAQRGINSRAAAGKPHGTTPFGYQRVVTREGYPTWEEHSEYADIVREIARRVLAQEPSDAIAKDLNRRGIPTARGGLWSGGNLSRLIRRAVYAGLRVHKGKVLSDIRGTWPALLSEADHLRINARYDDPERDKYRHPAHVKYLGSGIYRCGYEGCEGRMRYSTRQDQAWQPRYQCRTCYKNGIPQAPLDLMIEGLMKARLSQRDILRELAESSKSEDTKRAADEVVKLEGKIKELQLAYDDDELSLTEYNQMKRPIQARLEKAQKLSRPKHIPEVVFEVAGPDAAQKWDDTPIEGQRAIIGALIEVTVLPTEWRRTGIGERRPFRTEDVKVTRK